MSTGRCVPVPVPGTGTMFRFWPTVLPVRNPTRQRDVGLGICAKKRHPQMPIKLGRRLKTSITWNTEQGEGHD